MNILQSVRILILFATFVFAQNISLLHIEEDALAFTTDTRFLSFNIDAQVLPKFGSANLFNSKRFQTLMSALTPCWIRLGGTQGDHNVFHVGTPYKSPSQDRTYTLPMFESFCLLSSMFNVNFTFGLNLLLRQGDSWDPSNARELMNVLRNCRVHFELGNEPDLYFSQGYAVNASQLATDFSLARKVIDEMKFNRKSFLFGPDVASPLLSGYFEHFLKSLPSNGVLDAVTYHHFYDQANIADPEFSYDPLILDKFLDRASYASSLSRKYQHSAPLILGESADYTGEGAAAISNTYLTGFMFLDSLGVAAALEHSIYFKQSLFGTKYSAILEITSDLSSANPTAPFWISLIYRRFVSARVLTVTGNLARGRHVRIYAHCLNGTTNGSVVVYLMNLDPTPQGVQLSNTAMASSPQHWYMLTSDKPDLSGLDMYLNGNKLVMSGNDTLPEILPDVRPAGPVFQLPPRQYGFIVFPNAKIKPCIQSVVP